MGYNSLMYGYGFDPTYLLVIIGTLLSLWASSGVKSAFNKYDKVQAKSGLTGAKAAELILKNHGIYDVQIQRISGNLTDNYVPSKKTLNLSDSSYNSTSIAAIGVAAHECGHAIQDATEYAPLKISMAVHPICTIGSNLGFPIAIAGILFSFEPIIGIGVLLFTLGVALSLITLPVEYNASDRALATLDESGLLTKEELVGTKKVLRAAGLTYVAAAASMILSLLRLLILSRNNRRRN